MKSFFALRSFLVASSLLATTMLHAANGTWITDGNGNWNAPVNWSGGGEDNIADGADFTAFFTAELTGGVPRVVTLGVNRAIGNITFTDGVTSDTNLTITGNTLTLDTTSSVPVIDVTQPDRTLLISSLVAGNDGLVKIGAGTLQFNVSAPTYTGATRIDAGSLLVSNPAFLGATSSVILNGSSARLRLSVSSNFTLSKPLEVTANGGTLSKGNTATLNVTSPITISGSGDRTLALQNDGTGAATMTSNLGNPGDGSLFLSKTGTGTWVLSGNNSYTGTTSVNGGVLAIGNTSALSGTTAIHLGATLGGTLQFNVADTTVNSPITVADTGVLSTISTGHIAGGGIISNTNLNGGIGGVGNVRFAAFGALDNTYSTFTLNAASSYLGSTTIDVNSTNNNLFLVLGIANALPSTTVLNFAGTANGAGSGRTNSLDLNGRNQTLAGLSSVGLSNRIQRVNNTSETAATLTINDDGNRTFTGVLGSTRFGGAFNPAAANNFSVVKNGTGTWTLAPQATGTATNSLPVSNSYTGPTTINGGTLALGGNNVLPDSSNISMGAATLDAATFTDTVGNLEINAAATINLGTGAALVFDDSSEVTWSGSLKLTGSFVPGSSLRFGDGAGIGLSSGQLSLITASGWTSFAVNGQGFLTATGTAGYSSWATLNGAGTNLDGDHDNDGVSNGIEYFLGGPSGNTTGFTALPGVNEDEGGSLSVTWTQADDYSGTYGTDFWVETSSTLTAPWTTESEGVTVTITDNDVKYTFPAGTRHFARLKVSGP